MRKVRFSLLALIIGVIVATVAPAAASAAVGIEKFSAANCGETFERCGERTVGADIFGAPLGETVEPSLAESEAQGYRQAGGRVPFGATDFMVAHTGDYAKGEAVPAGIVTHVRVDVAAGLATSPVAVPQCTMAEFGATEVVPGSGFYPAPTCKEGAGPHGIGPASTVIGEEQATVYVKAAGGKPDIALKGKLYNLVPPSATSTSPARSSLFGAALALPTAFTGGVQLYAHTIVEGNVEWGAESKGTGAADYHDYFEVRVSPALPLIRSRQLDYGRAGNGAFITNATACPGNHTTFLSLEGVGAEGTENEVKARLESPERETTRRPYTTLLGLNECGRLPFEPTFSLTPGSPAETASDSPDGITTVAEIPHFPENEVDSSQLKTATVTLPEGMTLNPSAAAGLTDCTPAQARIHSAEKGTACPASSELGTVALNVPTLPDGSFTGKVYLGGPESGPITGPPYVLYVDAESERYGVSVRLKGETTPDATTGRVTTVFSENPEQPFTSLALHFNGGALAPIANPISCAAGNASASFTPLSEPGTTKTLTPAFAATGCASPVAFTPAQSTTNQSPNAGANTSFTFNLERPAGNQFVSQVKTTLPAGLAGAIPAATQCAEPGASKGECPSTSQIGIATVLAGSGATPYQFTGAVYLTGPYNGAPFGMSINVPAVAGPFNLGPVVTRATINIDPSTARVTVTSVLPRIVKGIPLRVRRISVAVNKQGFLRNPTSCSPLSTDSAITGFVPGSTESTTTPLTSTFAVGNCSALAFKPAFKAVTDAKTSKANGASLETTINLAAGSSNIKSVLVQLPKQLPSRLTTLQKACLAATFEANPYSCPSGSFVGGVRANTPLLAGKMKGPAILVSHGGAKFPDLDLVLEGEGVRVIVVGNTNIKNGITTTNFATTPDVPVTSITVNLPIGKHSAVTAFGNVCAAPLVMPTTLTGQNGVVVKQNTRIKLTNCGVRITGHKVVGNTAYLTVQTPAAGRVSGSGGGLGTVYRHFNGAKKTISLRIPLNHRGRLRGRPFHAKIRVGFVPRHGRNSVATLTVTFR